MIQYNYIKISNPIVSYLTFSNDSHKHLSIAKIRKLWSLLNLEFVGRKVISGQIYPPCHGLFEPEEG